MSNCISLRMAIFRAFTVLTSFYEITAWTVLITVAYQGALCPRARRELNSALGSFRDNRAPRLPSVSRREIFRTVYRSVRNAISQKFYKLHFRLRCNFGIRFLDRAYELKAL